MFLLISGCVGTPSMMAAPSDLFLEDANNYAWSATLTAANTDIAAGSDFTIDWSALTVDLYGRPFDGTVDELMLLELGVPRTDFERLFAADELVQADISTAWLYESAESDRSILASQLEIIGNEFDVEHDSAEGTSWAVVLHDTSASWNVHAIHYVTPVATSTNTLVALPDGGSSLTATPDLHSMPPLQAVAGAGPYRLDWSGLTVDLDQVDEVVVARLDVTTPQDAEPLIATLDDHAAELYSLALPEDAVVTDAELPFPGFTTSGVWLVGLRCTYCIAPMAMAVVEVN